MKTNASLHAMRQEAPLLFALLDAAEHDGRMRDAVLERWTEAKRRVYRSQDYGAEGELFCELLAELEGSRSLDGSWIGARWQAVEHRLAEAC